MRPRCAILNSMNFSHLCLLLVVALAVAVARIESLAAVTFTEKAAGEM